jgi:hypothetical protein
MLNNVFGAFVKHTKIEIKDKINIDKITFYILDALNAQVLRHN